MTGALLALHEMESEGFQLYICTSPILTSQYCAQEKLNWIRHHLGEKWLSRVIITADKSVVRGDILIDDKPFESMDPGGRHSTATWKQILFDAPYNQQPFQPRLMQWKDWRDVVYPLLGKALHVDHGQEKATTTATTTAMPPPPPRVSTQGRPPKHHYGGGGKKSASEIQRVQDLLQGDQEPLSPEDIASIVSGSVSLLDDDDMAWEELLDEMSLEDIGELVHSANEAAKAKGADISALSDAVSFAPVPSTAAKAQKKRELQDKLMEISHSHRKEVRGAERKAALESDEGEGVQVFRQSYQNWKKRGPTKSNIF
jgi:hypothetical protein